MKPSTNTFKLRVWRQNGPNAEGRFEDYSVKDVTPDMSFLEMLDVVNDELEAQGTEPIAFGHDCREGICGSCGMVIDGVPHSPKKAVATCQVYMRQFDPSEVIHIEPWRAQAMPVLKDLIVDRSALDNIIEAGGYVSVNTGSAPDANAIPIPKNMSEGAMDAASCIGCGACVAACKNASGMLFTSAKVNHLGMLPQGQPERYRRVVAMVQAHDAAGFGACSNTGSCEAVCPKEISITNIHKLNRDYLVASIFNKD